MRWSRESILRERSDVGDLSEALERKLALFLGADYAEPPATRGALFLSISE